MTFDRLRTNLLVFGSLFLTVATAQEQIMAQDEASYDLLSIERAGNVTGKAC
jgi:hypothetical protein